VKRPLTPWSLLNTHQVRRAVAACENLAGDLRVFQDVDVVNNMLRRGAGCRALRFLAEDGD
jgi:hypothetical protein